MDILTNYWIWWIIAAVLMSLEIFTPGAFMIWIGFAAALTGLVAWIFPGMSLELELLSFALFSVAFAVMGRNYVGKRQKPTDHPNLNVRGAQYVGKTVRVIKPIQHGKGKVKVGDSEWLASGPDAKVGESVKVVGIKGTTLEIERKD